MLGALFTVSFCLSLGLGNSPPTTNLAQCATYDKTVMSVVVDVSGSVKDDYQTYRQILSSLQQSLGSEDSLPVLLRIAFFSDRIKLSMPPLMLSDSLEFFKVMNSQAPMAATDPFTDFASLRPMIETISNDARLGLSGPKRAIIVFSDGVYDNPDGSGVRLLKYLRDELGNIPNVTIALVGLDRSSQDNDMWAALPSNFRAFPLENFNIDTLKNWLLNACIRRSEPSHTIDVNRSDESEKRYTEVERRLSLFKDSIVPCSIIGGMLITICIFLSKVTLRKIDKAPKWNLETRLVGSPGFGRGVRMIRTTFFSHDSNSASRVRAALGINELNVDLPLNTDGLTYDFYKRVESGDQIEFSEHALCKWSPEDLLTVLAPLEFDSAMQFQKELGHSLSRVLRQLRNWVQEGQNPTIEEKNDLISSIPGLITIIVEMDYDCERHQFKVDYRHEIPVLNFEGSMIIDPSRAMRENVLITRCEKDLLLFQRTILSTFVSIAFLIVCGTVFVMSPLIS